MYIPINFYCLLASFYPLQTLPLEYGFREKARNEPIAAFIPCSIFAILKSLFICLCLFDRFHQHRHNLK